MSLWHTVVLFFVINIFSCVQYGIAAIVFCPNSYIYVIYVTFYTEMGNKGDIFIIHTEDIIYNII